MITLSTWRWTVYIWRILHVVPLFMRPISTAAVAPALLLSFLDCVPQFLHHLVRICIGQVAEMNYHNAQILFTAITLCQILKSLCSEDCTADVSNLLCCLFHAHDFPKPVGVFSCYYNFISPCLLFWCSLDICMLPLIMRSSKKLLIPYLTEYMKEFFPYSSFGK